MIVLSNPLSPTCIRGISAQTEITSCTGECRKRLRQTWIEDHRKTQTRILRTRSATDFNSNSENRLKGAPLTTLQVRATNCTISTQTPTHIASAEYASTLWVVGRVLSDKDFTEAPMDTERSISRRFRLSLKFYRGLLVVIRSRRVRPLVIKN